MVLLRFCWYENGGIPKRNIFLCLPVSMDSSLFMPLWCKAKSQKYKGQSVEASGMTMPHTSCLPTSPSHPHSGLSPEQDSIAAKWPVKSSSGYASWEMSDALGTGNNMSQFGCVWLYKSYHIIYCSNWDLFESESNAVIIMLKKAFAQDSLMLTGTYSHPAHPWSRTSHMQYDF